MWLRHLAQVTPSPALHCSEFWNYIHSSCLSYAYGQLHIDPFPSCTCVVASLGSSHSVIGTALLQVTPSALVQNYYKSLTAERKGVLRYGGPQAPFDQISKLYKLLVCLCQSKQTIQAIQTLLFICLWYHCILHTMVHIGTGCVEKP